MIHKKMFLIVCLFSTGLLVAADKKILPAYASFEIVSPMEQLLGMVKKGFADIDSRLDFIDSKVLYLNERVDRLDAKVEQCQRFQGTARVTAFGFLKALGSIKNSYLVMFDKEDDIFTLVCNGRRVSFPDEEEEIVFAAKEIIENTGQLVELIKKNSYACFYFECAFVRLEIKSKLLSLRDNLNDLSNMAKQHFNRGHFEDQILLCEKNIKILDEIIEKLEALTEV